VTLRYDFIDFLFTEQACFLLAGKIIDSKKVWSKNSHQKWLVKMVTHQNWLIHQKNSIWVLLFMNMNICCLICFLYFLPKKNWKVRKDFIKCLKFHRFCRIWQVFTKFSFWLFFGPVKELPSLEDIQKIMKIENWIEKWVFFYIVHCHGRGPLHR
jgi:hypothetical protein